MKIFKLIFYSILSEAPITAGHGACFALKIKLKLATVNDENC